MRIAVGPATSGRSTSIMRRPWAAVHLQVSAAPSDLDGDGAFDDATGPTASFKGIRGPGAKAVAVQVSDGSLTSVARTTVTVTVEQPPAQ